MTRLVESAGGPRKIVGYCWPSTVRPGELVDFMVSCAGAGAYRAELVRIVCGDDLLNREGFEEKEIPSSFNGDYPGRFQTTHPGSYVEIAPREILDSLPAFTVQTMVCPTLLPHGARVRSGGVANSWEDPSFDEQHLVSRWDEQMQQGWALLIDRTGRPVFKIGKGGTTQHVVLARALLQDKWFLVTGSFDAKNGSLRVAARAVACTPGDSLAWPAQCQEEIYPGAHQVAQATPLRFAACTTDGARKQSRLKPIHCFNGRLDRVRLTRGALELSEALELAKTTPPPYFESRIIGFWDFAKDIDRIEITDLSSNALHGVTVNVPTRAVRGVDWDGSVSDWRVRPDHYSAIHFHDDDLYDAEWVADFRYTVPNDLPSGIYAARLRQGVAEDYIPFFVAPPRGQAQSAVAFLVPTVSYAAYTNITGLTTLKRKREVKDSSGELQLIEEDLHPHVFQHAADAAFLLEHHKLLGKGIYANHTDGTLVSYASQRHVNMTMKPKGITWTLVVDTFITDWLEQKEIRYDVITDDLLHEEGVDLLKRYTVILTGSHPEYYTRRMLDAVDQYQRAGGRWMYLGGNGFYWVTSMHAQLPGVIEVRKNIYAGHAQPYERRHAFDAESGGTWADCGRPPSLLMGISYDATRGYAMESGAPYKRLPDSYLPRAAFIFDGITQESIGHDGLFGGAAGQEVDTIDQEHTPAHVMHLARADSFARYGSLVAEEYRANTCGPVADLVFFETPNGGAVFSVGSISWVGALSLNGYENDVSRITENVLRRFTDRKPFLSSDSATPVSIFERNGSAEPTQ